MHISHEYSVTGQPAVQKDRLVALPLERETRYIESPFFKANKRYVNVTVHYMAVTNEISTCPVSRIIESPGGENGDEGRGE